MIFTEDGTLWWGDQKQSGVWADQAEGHKDHRCALCLSRGLLWALGFPMQVETAWWASPLGTTVGYGKRLLAFEAPIFGLL